MINRLAKSSNVSVDIVWFSLMRLDAISIVLTILRIVFLRYSYFIFIDFLPNVRIFDPKTIKYFSFSTKNPFFFVMRAKVLRTISIPSNGTSQNSLNMQARVILWVCVTLLFILFSLIFFFILNWFVCLRFNFSVFFSLVMTFYLFTARCSLVNLLCVFLFDLCAYHVLCVVASLFTRSRSDCKLQWAREYRLSIQVHWAKAVLSFDRVWCEYLHFCLNCVHFVAVSGISCIDRAYYFLSEKMKIRSLSLSLSVFRLQQQKMSCLLCRSGGIQNWIRLQSITQLSKAVQYIYIHIS